VPVYNVSMPCSAAVSDRPPFRCLLRTGAGVHTGPVPDKVSLMTASTPTPFVDVLKRLIRANVPFVVGGGFVTRSIRERNASRRISTSLSRGGRPARSRVSAKLARH
jgi:hypothetical protein